MNKMRSDKSRRRFFGVHWKVFRSSLKRFSASEGDYVKLMEYICRSVERLL